MYFVNSSAAIKKAIKKYSEKIIKEIKMLHSKTFN